MAASKRVVLVPNTICAVMRVKKLFVLEHVID